MLRIIVTAIFLLQMSYYNMIVMPVPEFITYNQKEMEEGECHYKIITNCIIR